MRTRQLLTATLSGLLLAAVLTGLPVLLLAVGGNPLPTRVPSLDQVIAALTAPDDGRLVLRAAVLLGWVCWALLLLAAVGESIDQIAAARGTARSRPRPAVGMSMPRSLMRPLVASILAVLVSAPAAGTLAAGPAVAHTATELPVDATPVDDPARRVGPDRVQDTGIQGQEDDPMAATHTVAPGDTLWDIATDHLGAGEHYPELYAANADQLSSPDLIYPGTVLVLPGTPATIRDLETLEVQVQAGDTLSALAHDHLGDATRWPEIFTASQQVDQGDGIRLSDPDLIQVGWQLKIPTQTHTAEPLAEPAPQDAPTPAQDPTTPRENADGPAALRGAATRASDLGRHLAAVDTPAQAAPPASQTPVATDGQEPGGGADGPVVDDSDQGTVLPLGAGWLIAGLAGSGGLLAGALWLELRTRRRTQARFRRPALGVGAPIPAELGPIEATTQVVGPVAAVSLQTLDRVLKHLALTGGEQVPALAAVRLSSQDGIDVLLAEPADLPDPWQRLDNDGTRWRLPRPMTGPAPNIQAPYPLLAVVGTDDTEATWLLHLEGMHVAITGDLTMGQDLARHITAGALLNPWSGSVQVDCLGLAQELEQVDPDRIHTHPADSHLAQVHEDLARTVARAHRHQVDVSTARAQAIGDDTWPAHLVMVGLSTEETRQIAHTICAEPTRGGAAVIVTGTPGTDEHPSLVLDIDAQGRVQVGDVGLELVAVGLTEDEATGCAMMCAAATDHHEHQVPDHDVDDPQDRRHYVDRAGGLREPFRTAPEPSNTSDADTGPEPVEEEPGAEPTQDTQSVLPAPHEDYVAVAATTVQDLAQVAPQVSHETRDAILGLDPDLDEDLAAWHDDQARRPRLSLLGPVKAQTFGAPQSHSKAYLTEILTYLALRPEGAPPDQLAEAFGLTPKKARDYVSTLRKWLGTDPRTGELHLPHADDTARHDGVKVYRVSGLLVDADLFTRLHTRGVSRGPYGVEDLLAALRLVTGQPFDQLRPGGWAWFFESSERHDQYHLVAIGTVAHLITIHSLDSGNREQARWAAQLASKADPYAETPNLDLAAVAMAEGRHHDSARLLRTHVTDRSDDRLPPPDLPPRTTQILNQNPDWLDTDRDAAAS